MSDRPFCFTRNYTAVEMEEKITLLRGQMSPFNVSWNYFPETKPHEGLHPSLPLFSPMGESAEEEEKEEEAAIDLTLSWGG